MATCDNDDWRIGCNDIPSMQNKARRDARFTDIQFIIENGDSRKQFHAHKSILACASPVFEKIFYGELAQKRHVIETDDDPGAFDLLLNFIYGEKKKITSLTSASAYLTVCDKYLIPEIQDDVKEHIESIPIDEDAFWEFIQSNIILSPFFQSKALPYIMKNANQLLKSEKFLNAPESFVDTIIQIDELNIEEYELSLAVTKWAYKNIPQANFEILIKFYKHVRFSTMASNNFFQFIESYPQAIDAKDS